MQELSALGSDDYLVLQHGSGSSKQSYKISFSDFKKQFLDKMKTIDLKSAASCDIAQFAPFAHGHDYTDLYYFPSYGPKSSNTVLSCRDPANCIYDGKFNIVKYLPGADQKNVHTVSAWQPIVKSEIVNEISDYTQYRVGDLQLFAIKNFQTYLTAYCGYQITNNNININHSSFDGFVIPNGSIFYCAADKFKTACRLYAGNENATSFKVPDLSQVFFKCDPGLPTSTMNPMSTVNGNTVFLGHSHSGSVSMDGSVSMTFNNIRFSTKAGTYSRPTSTILAMDGMCVIAGGSDGYAAGGCHTYDEYPDGYKPAITGLNMTCSLNNGMTCTAASNSSPTYPSYVNIQALLYIGMPQE